MFTPKFKARMRLGLCVLFGVVAVVFAFKIPWFSGWFFAMSLYYLHLNTEHS